MPTASLDITPYAEIVRRPLDAQRCVLLVIDIQEKLLPPIYEKERLVRNSQLLIRLAKILSMPMLFSTQYAKGLGQTIPEISFLAPGIEVTDKLQFGCFANGEFCSTFATIKGRDTLLLCGIE